VEIGESAGPTITLPAAVLRSTQLEIIGSGTGSGGTLDMWKEAFREVMAQLRRGDLKIEVQQVPLADVEKAWSRDQRGARFVLVP
jgi:NADPH2:quinone reductase